VTSQACQDEIFYYELMEVTDFRNDVILAEACRGDVESLCLDVEPGEGRVHQCLRMHRDELSPKCKQEEMKLAAIEYRDIRLRPKLNKLCSEEKAVYCKVSAEMDLQDALLSF
jgi:Golgi apparatus protein 1